MRRSTGAEFDAAMAEGVWDVTAKYKAQLQQVRDRAWEIGWKAALKKVGVLGDDPAFRNPPKFPSSDSDLLSIVGQPSASGPSSEVTPAMVAAPEACLATSKATPADPQSGPPEVEAS